MAKSDRTIGRLTDMWLIIVVCIVILSLTLVPPPKDPPTEDE
jgi:hypothetical protein